MLLRIALFVSIVLLSACGKRFKPLVAVPEKPVNSRAYVDLTPGCRLRVVTPLFASGKQTEAYDYTAAEPSKPGSPITLTAPPGFIGYETAYYLLKPRSDGRGSSIVFQYATTTKSGVVRRENRPSERLFRVPRDIRFFRLVFLVRVSRSDHNMALLGTKRKDVLDNWTAFVVAHPNACTNFRDRTCSWVPAGIAVRPEIEKQSRWVPLR